MPNSWIRFLLIVEDPGVWSYPNDCVPTDGVPLYPTDCAPMDGVGVPSNGAWKAASAAEGVPQRGP